MKKLPFNPCVYTVIIQAFNTQFKNKCQLCEGKMRLQKEKTIRTIRNTLQNADLRNGNLRARSCTLIQLCRGDQYVLTRSTRVTQRSLYRALAIVTTDKNRGKTSGSEKISMQLHIHTQTAKRMFSKLSCTRSC